MGRSIAVVVATYGDFARYEDLAKRALKSIAAQTRRPDEIIRAHGVTLAAARNAGAAQATTDLVQFVDADDGIHPDACRAFSDADPSIDILQPAIQAPWLNGEWTQPVVWEPCDFHTGNYLVVGCAVRRDLFLAHGGFDDYDALEDWALWWKLSIHGAKIAACPEAIYRVIGSGTPGRNSNTQAVARARDAIVDRFSALAQGKAPLSEGTQGRRGGGMAGVIAYVGNFEPRHSTETHVARTLEEDLGWRVERLQENRFTTSEIFDRTIRSGARLLLYTRTWGFMGGDGNQLLRDLHAHGIPTASYHLDLYWGIAREKSIVGDPFWNTKYVFTADGGSEDQFRLAGINHRWVRAGVFRQECTMAAPDDRFRSDVAFVGALDEYHPEWLPYRQELKRHLVEWFGPRFKYWPPPGQPSIRNEDLNALYASAKVVVGDSLCVGFKHPRYWSDRLYETVGRGGFIIHPRIEGILDEFVDGKTIVTFQYNDWDSLKAKIDYYLEHEEDRLRIRDAGHAFVKEHCTYTNRLREMLRHVATAEGWTDLPAVMR